MKVMVIPILDQALWLVLKGFERRLEIKEITETIQTTALSRPIRLLWRVLDLAGELKAVEHEGDSYTDPIGNIRSNPKNLEKRLRGTRFGFV